MRPERQESSIGIVNRCHAVMTGSRLCEHRLHRFDFGKRHFDGVEPLNKGSIVVILFGAGGNRLSDAGARSRIPGRGGAEIACAQPLAITAAVVHAQAEHEQAIVSLSPETHQFAGDEDGNKLAIDRAFERNVLQALNTEIERGFPRAAKTLGTRLAAQIIAAVSAHIHLVRSTADTARVGKCFDKCALAFGSPAIMTDPARDGIEFSRRRAVGASNGCSVLHWRFLASKCVI